MGSEGLVFCPTRKQLYYLNNTATYIWCGLKEGLEPPQIASDLASQFQVSSLLANRHVNYVLENWASAGLATAAPPSLEATTSPENFDARATPLKAPEKLAASTEHSRIAHSDRNALASKALEWQYYRLGEMAFRIRYPSEKLRSCIHAALVHLEAAAKWKPDEAPLSIDILSEGELFQLDFGNEVSDELFTYPELAPRIHQIILTKAYEASGCLAGFHAGAVANKDGCVLLPGAPGSGKSTLVAALVDAGHTFLTDELLLLMPDASLRPLPISLGLKKGSWPVLKPIIPTVEQLPVHLQADGTEVRYVTPASTPPHCTSPPLRTLVFPKYVAGAKTELTPISAARTFYRLSIAGYAVPGGLNSSVVAALVDWVSRQQCYELQVGDLSRAVSIVGELLA